MARQNWALVALVLLLALGEARDHRFNSSTVAFNTEDVLEYPSMFLIGAQKAATTTFYEVLVRHPSICRFGEKEKHFVMGKEYKTGYANALQKYKSEFAGCNSSQLTLDATPEYSAGFYALTFGRMKRHYTRETLLKKKFLYILREPIARIHSEYSMAVRLCLDLDSDLQKSNMKDAEVEWRRDRFMRSCERVVVSKKILKPSNIGKLTAKDVLTFNGWVLSEFGVHEVLRGNYINILRELTSGFLSRKQLFVINFDVLVRNVSVVLNGLQGFLDLKEPWAINTKMPTSHHAPISNPEFVMDCDTVNMLKQYYFGASGCSEACLMDFIRNSGPSKYEPAFGRFVDPSTKCVNLNTTSDKLREDIKTFAEIMRREEQNDIDKEIREIGRESLIEGATNPQEHPVEDLFKGGRLIAKGGGNS